jgi:hypothetical protein
VVEPLELSARHARMTVLGDVVHLSYFALQCATSCLVFPWWVVRALEEALGESRGADTAAEVDGKGDPTPPSPRSAPVPPRAPAPSPPLLKCPAPQCGFEARSPNAKCPSHGYKVR